MPAVTSHIVPLTYDPSTSTYTVSTAPYQVNYTIDEKTPDDGVAQVGEALVAARIDPPPASFDLSYYGTAHLGLIITNEGNYYLLTNVSSITPGTVLTGFSATDFDLDSPVPCFLAGTMIATRRGPVAVETLADDDEVATLSGGFRPVRWIGRRRISEGLAARTPGRHLPICIAAGAMGPGLPARTLWLSPEHCLHHDGALIPAKMLVNGTTVTQRHPGRPIDYVHVLLDEHDVILSEGVASESYLPATNEFGFANRDSFPANVARVADATAACLQVRPHGAEADALATLLRARAAELGHSFTTSADLHLLADGQTVLPQVDGNRHRFALTDRPASLIIASRAAAPIWSGAASRDRRLLGVALKTVELEAGGTRISIPHDSDALAQGFHAAEPHHRWTDGAAHIPAALLASLPPGSLTVTLTIGRTGLSYPVAARADTASAA